MSRYGASTFSSLLKDCVLWAPLQHSAGVSGDIDEFPIIPSGVTVTNNGTFTKSSLGNNKSVLNFDGSTNYVSLSDDASYELGSDSFTICWWEKRTSVVSYDYVLFKQSSGGNYGPIALCYYSGYLRCYISSNNTTWDIADHVIMGSYEQNVWNHFTLTRSGTTFYTYKNGTQVSTFSSSATLYNNSEPWTIGRGYSAGYRFMNGNLKDLMIWKGRALTQPEIKLLMNRTHPETGAGLMPINGEYWRLS